MEDYRIELLELQKNFNKLFEQREKPVHLLEIQLMLKDIEEEQIRKNPFQPNDDEFKVFISSEHISFHFLLALYLFVNSPLKYHDILEYHRKKFEYNNLIKKAPFLKLLSTYVLETIKTTGTALLIENLEQIVSYLNEYIERSKTGNYEIIVFDFKGNWHKVKKELKDHVDDEDFSFLIPFFESKVLYERVRFKLNATSLAELFLRFYNHGVVDSKTSKLKIAEWLHARVLVKYRNEEKFVVPSTSYLENILLKRRKTNLSNRILLNLYP
ncbi:MAG: hypothetical protein WCL56_12485 [Sediminibacterium sp.]